MTESNLKPKQVLAEKYIPALQSIEAVISEYQNYISKKGYEIRKISYLKNHIGKFCIANQNITALDITPEKYIDCLDIKFKEINKREIVLNPGHLSSALAKDYVLEKIKYEREGVLIEIERSAQLVANQNKYIKKEDDDRLTGLRKKISSGTVSPWEFFYYKARAIQMEGQLPEWIANAETKMKEAYHGKTKKS